MSSDSNCIVCYEPTRELIPCNQCINILVCPNCVKKSIISRKNLKCFVCNSGDLLFPICIDVNNSDLSSSLESLSSLDNSIDFNRDRISPQRFSHYYAQNRANNNNNNNNRNNNNRNNNNRNNNVSSEFSLRINDNMIRSCVENRAKIFLILFLICTFIGFIYIIMLMFWYILSPENLDNAYTISNIFIVILFSLTIIFIGFFCTDCCRNTQNIA